MLRNSCRPIASASSGAGQPSYRLAAARKYTNARPTVTMRSMAADIVESEVKASVQNYYGEVLKTSDDLKTSACCTANPPVKLVRDILAKVPEEVQAKYYGCGSPFPMGIQGLRVLDLGCGSGRDCFVCSALVGENGFVTGIDMTPGQLEVAQRNVDAWTSTMGYAQSNVKFVRGEIEDLKSAGIEDESIDIIISNCVINLSPNKAAVLREAWRALAPGGEMYFSDVYCDRRLSRAVQMDPVLLGECLGGAMYTNDFIRLCREVGFTDPRQLSSTPIEVRDEALRELLGDAKFTSVTYRLFKLPGRLETLCEDYGQVAVYKGTIPTHSHAYALDDHHRFVTNKPMLVCGNTSSMVEETWLRPHFTVMGNRDVHYGEFDCSGAPAAMTAAGDCASGDCC